MISNELILTGKLQLKKLEKKREGYFCRKREKKLCKEFIQIAMKITQKELR